MEGQILKFVFPFLEFIDIHYNIKGNLCKRYKDIILQFCYVIC